MRKALGVITILLGSIMAMSCTTQEAKKSAEVAIVVAGGAAAVINAREAYDTAVIALEAEKDKFPIEVQDELYRIKGSVDALIAMAERRTNSTTDTLAFVAGDGERFYLRLETLRQEGKQIIAPYRSGLSDVTQWVLDDLANTMDQLGAANQLYKNDPSAANAAEVARLTMQGISVGVTLLKALIL